MQAAVYCIIIVTTIAYYCILLITIALYCTIAVCVDMLWEILGIFDRLWTSLDICPSTGHLHRPACPAACPLSTGLGQSCSTPQHHASQPRAAWPWDAMDTVDTWTPKRCRKIQKEHCFLIFLIFLHCNALHIAFGLCISVNPPESNEFVWAFFTKIRSQANLTG